MGVADVQVHPAHVSAGRAGVFGRVEVSTGDHYLPHARGSRRGARSRVGEDVPVGVYIGEAVVVADDLKLIQGLPERPVVPQPQVLDGRRLTLNVRLGHGGGRLVLLRVGGPGGQVERQPRHVDVALDVLRFLGLLVRVNRQALDELRVADFEDEEGADPEEDGEDQRRPPAGDGEAHHETADESGQDRHHVHDQHPGVAVRVADALEDAAGVAVHELIAVELIADGDRPQVQSRQDSQMDAGRRRHRGA